MHLFDDADKLKKYNSVEEIIDDYFDVRLDLYDARKDYMIDALEKELVLLSNKAKYIKENLEGTIDLRKKKREEVNKMLKDKNYDMIDEDEDYKYLVKMPMDSVTEENVNRLMNGEDGKKSKKQNNKEKDVNNKDKNKKTVVKKVIKKQTQSVEDDSDEDDDIVVVKK